MKQRLDYIDHLKGFAIFLVVVGHVIQYNTSDFRQSPVFSAIYSFHMPLFFFLSGYIAAKSKVIDDLSGFLNATKSKAVALLMPLFAWGIISVFVSSVGDVTFDDVINSITRQITSPSLWFLHTLFLIFLLKYAIDLAISIGGYSGGFLGVAALVCLCVAVGTALSIIFKYGWLLSFVMHFSFFMLGLFVSRHETLQRMYRNKTLYMVSFFVFAGLMSSYDFSDQASAAQKAIKLGSSIFATVFFYGLFRRTHIPTAVKGILFKMGTASLAIYVTHMTLIGSIGFWIPESLETQPLLKYGGVTLIGLAWVLFCLGFAKAVEVFPVLNFLLYGRRFRN